MFLSAQAAPDAARVKQLYDLPDDEFRAEVMALGGIAPEIADDPDVMAVLMTALRADFDLWERHRWAPAAPLDCPITVLCGESDPRASRASVALWKACTTAEFSAQFYPGGHFYFLSATADVVSFIGQKMMRSTTNRVMA